MCEPMTIIGIAGLALSAGSSIMSYSASQQQGEAAARQGRAQARMSLMQGQQAIQNATAVRDQTIQQQKILEDNRLLSLRAAKDARMRGQADEERQRIKTGQLEGRQRAVMAANGIEVGYGSSLDILGDTAMIGEMDALTIQRNAEGEARRGEATAHNFELQSEAAGLRGKQAMEAGAYSNEMYSVAASNQVQAGAAAQSGFETQGAAQLLSGTATVAQKWYAMGGKTAFAV